MVIDRNYILFSSALSELAAQTCSVELGHSESELFMKRVYDEYLLTSYPEPNVNWIKSIPLDVKSWMVNVIQENFLFMNKKPKWVGGASWRFIDDVPMIFISQIEFESNEIMDKNLSSGDVLYIFSGRNYIDDGWELIIKMIKQDKNAIGTSYID